MRITNAIKQLVVKNYNNGKCILTVNGGTGSGEYTQKAGVSIVADTPVTGKKFSHWVTSSGDIYCYDSSATFYLNRDTILTAVYVDAASTIVQQALISIPTTFTQAGKIVFLIERIIPAGCTISTHGILLTNIPSIATNEGLIIDAPGVTKGNSGTTGLFGSFWVNKTAVARDVWYARGFVTYTDPGSNVITLYGNIVSGILS